MSRIRKILRDPLVHFLAGGALIFVASALLRGDAWQENETQVIRVDRATLLQYMQYRSAAFQPDYFKAELDAMTPEQRKALVDNYVREEAMVREARAMGLDGADYVIRQRLIQKMLFLVDDTAGIATDASDAALRGYFDAHKADYATAPALTFTHAFIDNERDHPEGREQAAAQLKVLLNAARAKFNDAPRYGDRFPFLQNYVERSTEFIANQFGPDFAGTVAALQPSEQWQGPFQSQYGWHVVLLTARSAGETPSFEAVADQVKDDYLAEQTAKFRDKALADLVQHYDVQIEGVELPKSGGK